MRHPPSLWGERAKQVYRRGGNLVVLLREVGTQAEQATALGEKMPLWMGTDRGMRKHACVSGTSHKTVLLIDSSYLRIGRDLLDPVSISSEIGKTGITWALWFRSGGTI